MRIYLSCIVDTTNVGYMETQEATTSAVAMRFWMGFAWNNLRLYHKGQCRIWLGLFMIQDYMEDIIELMNDIAAANCN